MAIEQTASDFRQEFVLFCHKKAKAEARELGCPGKHSNGDVRFWEENGSNANENTTSRGRRSSHAPSHLSTTTLTIPSTNLRI